MGIALTFLTRRTPDFPVVLVCGIDIFVKG